MTPALSASQIPPLQRPSAAAVRLQRAPVARTVLGFTLVLGVAADLLLRDGPNGLGLALWVPLAAATLIAMVWRADRTVPREARYWLGSAIVFATLVMLRGTEELFVLNFFATVMSLGLAAVVVSGAPIAGIFFARVRDVLTTAFSIVADGVGGAVPLVAVDGALASTRSAPENDKLKVFARAALITVPVLVLFGALLTSADPIFASWLTIPNLDFETAFQHIVLVVLFTWISAGWVRRAVFAEPGSISLPSPGITLGTTEITALLGSLIGLFAAFVVAQLGWFFGGETLLRERTGLTVAEYARRGFFELVWVALLVIPVLLATRVLIGRDRAVVRRHTRLALPLIALVGALMLSAVARMQLYVSYFGLTIDRFFALVFMAWLAVVLVWLAVTVLRGWDGPFVAGSVIAGLVGLVGVNALDPSAVIARTNLARTPPPVQRDSAGRAIHRAVDFAYLARLHDGAVPLVVRELVRSERFATATPALPGNSTTAIEWVESPRCAAVSTLLSNWGPTSRRNAVGENSWRAWNVGEARAVAVVREHASQLGVIHRECMRVKATRPRPATP
jgi:hypothetical protein